MSVRDQDVLSVEDQLYEELVEVSGGDVRFVEEWLISLITPEQYRDCIRQVKERMED